MSTMVSPGVYSRVVDDSFIVNSGGMVAGGIVVSAKKGPVGLNVVTSASEFVATYGLPTRDNPSLHCALRFLARAGILTVRRVTTDAVSANASIVQTVTTQEPNPAYEEGVSDPSVPEFIDVTDTVDVLTISAANQGSWGNDIRVTIADIDGAQSGVFAVVVSVKQDDGSFEEVESFEVSRNIDAKNGFGNTMFIEDVINGRSRYITVQDSPDASGEYPRNFHVLTGGLDDTVAPESGAIMSAWDEFKNEKEVPAQLLINAGWAVPAIQNKMIEVAETRRDAIAILDVPEHAMGSVTDMIEYRKNELSANSYFGALYGGWLKIYDQYNDVQIDVPPSGDSAAIYVHTWSVGERWYAPAGLRRGIIPNTVGVSKVFSQGERDQLAVAQINPVTAIGGSGSVVWGQDSLQVKASAMSKMNVVNSILFITKQMAESLDPFIHEVNTEQTRNAINFMLSSFLENIQLKGGLYDFFVDTSANINTPFVIDNNELHVDVYVQPTRVAEKIKLSVIVTPTGVSFA